ncbi:MAG: dehydrogenase, partial [Runella slithyformis]
FLGNSKKTVFALKSASSPEAVSQLIQLYQKGQIPAEYQKDVLASIAKFGSAANVTNLFELAIQENAGKNLPSQLAALETAARRNIKPTEKPNRVLGFVENEDEAVARAAMRLIGLWQLSELNDKLVSFAKNDTKNGQKTALDALIAMNSDQARQLVVGMTIKENSTALKLAAASRLVAANATQYAPIGAELLRSLPAEADVAELFRAFFANKMGVAALTTELNAKKIPTDRAIVGRQALQRLQSSRRNSEEGQLLIKALEASGGFLPVEKMPQELKEAEIASLAKTISETADPVKGEAIFRKSGLACFTCHAIGGAGGRIGPDLSSLGTSSPVATIIKSIIYPNASIKEGYELQRVVKKDKSEIMGYLVANGAAEIVLRDVTGSEIAIPKSQVSGIDKVAGSLMPAGLTAGLDQEEFKNLIGFLSKMGESGKFRVPTARLVRRWNGVASSKELIKKMATEGIGYVAKENAKLVYEPAYSQIAGDLPLDELPTVEISPDKKYTFVKFDLEVLSKGSVNLNLNTTLGVSIWVNGKPLKVNELGVLAELPAGIHSFTMALEHGLFKERVLSVQLPDTEGGTAQTRLVMGR